MQVEKREFARAPRIPGAVKLTVDNAVIHMTTDDVYTTGQKSDTPEDNSGLQHSSRRSTTTSTAATSTPAVATLPEIVGTNPVTLETTYAASEFPDYDPARFALNKARAVQFDFRDADNKLVPTPRLPEVFRPGTLVICTCSLSMWKFTKDGVESHTYQAIARSMRVVDDTPVYTDYTPPPAPPSAGPVLSPSPQKRLAEFDALDFSTPTKKPAPSRPPTHASRK
ncbi:hypothetical protein BOTBODRAFT_178772 [Botryobasidium botryosum FD-172 SS1]|uniref:Uncharacterized protein n=1 Tax=Botryobasidium botryosum (strain FD-172 SS1) TaxID=930990 RepID=A0A067M1Q6_BOTB1|nr:hypothetical protein BOTBODRAFT_178772 [Botryobasidium botryosum FD-172 SS1]